MANKMDITNTNLEKLRNGCFLRALQRENEEPELSALDKVSFELKHLQRQNQYASEIERVFKELRLTVLLIEECQTREIVTGVKRQELVVYYQGAFFNLVHQLKDKILQLVNLIIEEDTPKGPLRERGIKLNKFLKEKENILKSIGIFKELEQWDENNETSRIAVVLRKRTQHHHRVSKLRYDKDFLNLNFTDIAIQPNEPIQFTEYGKEQIEKMRTDSTESFYSNAISKAKETLLEIEDNIERLSDALINYYKLPVSKEETAKIVNNHLDMHDSFRVKNTCSKDKIKEPFKNNLR